jgi:hypothetical protein
VVNFSDTLKARAPLVNGVYVAEIADLPKPHAIDDYGRQGVSFVLKVAEGPDKNRTAVIELFAQSKAKSRVLHDIDLLSRWLSALNVTDFATPVEAIEKLRAASFGKRIEYTLRRAEWNGGLELRLVGVQVVANG